MMANLCVQISHFDPHCVRGSGIRDIILEGSVSSSEILEKFGPLARISHFYWAL